jgi:hypothetical protein
MNHIKDTLESETYQTELIHTVSILAWKWKQLVSTKYRYQDIRQNGVMAQKNIMRIFNATEAWNLTFCSLQLHIQPITALFI